MNTTPFVLNKPVALGELRTHEGLTYRALRNIAKPGTYPKEGAYWELIPELFVDNVLDMGRYIKGGTEKDAWPSMRDMLKDIPLDTGSLIKLPAGRCRLSKGLVIEGGSPTLLGIRNSSVLSVPGGVVGIEVRMLHGGDHPLLQDFILEAQEKKRDGYIGESRSYREQDYHYHAVKSNGMLDMFRVKGYRFSGAGLYIQADIYNKSALGAGENASGSNINQVSMKQMGSSGFFTIGSDATVFFDNIIASDNEGYNYHDASFLGCKVDKTMFHRGHLAHIRVSHEANHSQLTGLYCEDDSPKNYFGGQCDASGFIANGFYSSATARVQDGAKSARGIIASGTISYDDRGVLLKTNPYSQQLFLQVRESNGKSIIELAPSEQLGGVAPVAYVQNGARLIGEDEQVVDTFAINVLRLSGGILMVSMSSRGGNNNYSFVYGLSGLLRFKRGSRIYMEGALESEPKEYVCIEDGGGEGNPAAKWMAQGFGRGTSAERPSLQNKNYSNFNSDDFSPLVGWPYFNTDTNRQEFLYPQTMEWQ